MPALSSLISALKEQFEAQKKQTKNSKDIEALHVQFLGRKGSVTELFGQLKTLSLEEKKEVGPQLTELRTAIETSLSELKDALFAQEQAAARGQEQHFDVTAYQPIAGHNGHLHIYSHFVETIENIFMSMGYDVWEGKHAETDYYNFSALNIPGDHPARDMYDTLWLNRPNWLLRTHTSPVQVRMMEQKQLPLAGIVPGYAFRHEAVDASHDVMFMQCEGLFIDKNITLAHLFGTAKTFLSKLFERDDLDIRIRPGYFPFVEPGVEIDMRCTFCKNGCSVCKHSTWIEVFPGGMVHPNVLRMSGIDPEVYSGFAFGFGLTRLAMLKYGIRDIRLFHSGKMSFLTQF